MSSTTWQQQHQQRARWIFVAKFLAYAALILTAFTMIFPFYWMVATSLKSEARVFAFPPDWIPNPAILTNYAYILTELPFDRYIFNSVKVSSLWTFGIILSSSLAAYAFARVRFWGREALFVITLGALMIPGQITMIPLYVVMTRIGWVDTHLPLIVPAYLGSAFGIFLLRQSFKQIHQDFLDAARLDGCGHIGVMRHVLVPLTLPTLITFGLFSFVYHFNDLFWPLIVTDSQLMRTMPMGLSSFIEFEGGTQWNELMAASIFSMLPLIIVFLFAQSFFIKGIASAGLKG